MKYFLSLASFFILVLIYGLIISQFRPRILSSELSAENAPGYYDYKGVTNSHTSLNKGSLSPERVLKEAQAADLDFLIFTDLNIFKNYPLPQGYYDNLLSIHANAYSYLDSHIVYYSTDEKKTESPQFNGLGDVQMFLSNRFSHSERSENNDFTVLAHPFKGGRNWQGDYPKDLNGIEIINLKSVWRNSWQTSRLSFFWSVFIYPFNSHLALLRLFQAPQKELNLWDELNQKQKTVGFVGNESTSRTAPIFGKNFFRFPSYRTSFEIACNHVLLRSELTGDNERDRQKILQALKKGQFYLSLDYLEDPKGFVAFIKDGATQHSMGSEINWKKGLQLRAFLPRRPLVPFEIILYKDGIAIANSHSHQANFDLTEPGTYRITVRVIPTMPVPDGKQWISWIYTNPFFVN